jgi:hypothetical protein
MQVLMQVSTSNAVSGTSVEATRFLRDSSSSLPGYHFENKNKKRPHRIRPRLHSTFLHSQRGAVRKIGQHDK